MRTISLLEWLICATGTFFIGVGVGYIDVEVYNYGALLIAIGLILEIPAFYLIYKHK